MLGLHCSIEAGAGCRADECFGKSRPGSISIVPEFDENRLKIFEIYFQSGLDVGTRPKMYANPTTPNPITTPRHVHELIAKPVLSPTATTIIVPAITLARHGIPNPAR